MKTLLSCDVDTFYKKIRGKTVLCIAAACTVIVCNAVLCLLYRDEYADILKWINILLDITAAWLLYGYVSVVLLPEKKRLTLARRSRKFGQVLHGTVRQIGPETHHGGLRCRQIMIAAETERRVYLPDAIDLQLGDTADFRLCDNIVVEVKP